MSKQGFGDQIVFLYCGDLGETGSFYEDLLGLELVVDQGSCRIVRVAGSGGGYLGYCERRGGESAAAGLILTFVVPTIEEVDAWHIDLVEKGVKIQEPPRWNPRFGIYHFFFSDPDGYKLEIQSFEDRNWNSPL